MAIASTITLISSLGRTTKAGILLLAAVRSYAAMFFSVAFAVFFRGTRQDAYDLLWVVVFGFATLNILGLAARRMEPNRRGITFGEIIAVMVVLIAILLLGWEMLNQFHIFPIRLGH
jgi:hypothetical protein